MRSKPTKRILAVDLTSRGFGYAVLEGPERLVDWGVKQPKRYAKSKCVLFVMELIKQYHPDILIVENIEKSRFRSSDRVRELLQELLTLADKYKIATRQISWRDVRRTFSSSGVITKFRITRMIAKHLPVLIHRLPPF